MKYAVITFGCRVNQADSSTVDEDFRRHGGVPSPPEEADVVVVNTCSVTASADQAARQTIRRIGRVNPSAEIIVTGCYSTRRPEEVRDLPRVIHVVPNDQKLSLFSLTTASRYGEGEGACGAALEPGMAGRTAFTLRVQTGCAERCCYCIIPSTRGAPRSTPVNEVLAEANRAAAAGFKEIALTGVHLGSYGRDLQPGTTLFELLRRLVSDTDPSGRARLRFRISSLEPMDCSPDIVDLVEADRRFAPHFHLPLQHASDRLLAAMERPYTLQYYRSLVDRIRGRLPGASIGADVIVGFPGEADEDFAALAEYLEASPLTHLHVFPYSDRPGTAAAMRRDKVPGAIVRRRAGIVRDIGQRLTAAFRTGQTGTIHRALTIDDGTTAVTGNYLKVKIPPGLPRNEWVDVRIVAVRGAEVIGRLE